jgi:hypothetical protein
MNHEPCPECWWATLAPDTEASGRQRAPAGASRTGAPPRHSQKGQALFAPFWIPISSPTTSLMNLRGTLSKRQRLRSGWRPNKCASVLAAQRRQPLLVWVWGFEARGNACCSTEIEGPHAGWVTEAPGGRGLGTQRISPSTPIMGVPPAPAPL